MALIEKIGTYQIWQSDRHGRSTGKPGSYNKKTTGIQVRDYNCGEGGYLLLKTFNFPVGNMEKRAYKIFLAKEFIQTKSNG
jgi:hypothetical protein